MPNMETVKIVCQCVLLAMWVQAFYEMTKKEAGMDANTFIGFVVLLLTMIGAGAFSRLTVLF